MLCIYSTIYIEFDLRIFDLKITQIHIHRKPIRRFVFSVISVFYELQLGKGNFFLSSDDEVEFLTLTLVSGENV